MASTASILAQLRQASKAAETSQTALIASVRDVPEPSAPPAAQPTTIMDLKAIPSLSSLSDGLAQLAHADIAFRDKLVKQSMLFQCPQWCGVPSVGLAHLEVHREGVFVQNLWVNRFPYYLVGRDKRCDFVLEHPSASGVHCAILFHRERQCYVVLDLGSTNGVFLNGSKVEPKKPQAIEYETVIKFGHSTRTYILKKSEPRKEDVRPIEKAPNGTSLRTDKHSHTTTAPAGSSSEPGQQSDTAAAAAVAEPVAADTREPELIITRHIRHLLIKHKDVAKPVSTAARNKGEPITRSKEDALNLANAIRLLNSTWTEDQFAQACQEHGEDPRAASGGDLGMISRGDFAGPFDVAAFAIGIDQVSLPVETQLGVHLIFRCRE